MQYRKGQNTVLEVIFKKINSNFSLPPYFVEKTCNTAPFG